MVGAALAPARSDDRLTASLLLTGAILALIGNALHPFLPADTTTAELIEEAATGAIWVPLHLAIGLSIVLITAGVVLLGRRLRGTASAALGTVAAVVAVVGGTIFTAQITVLDGVVFPTLGELESSEATLAAAEAMRSLDVGLLSLAVILFLGTPFAVLGVAFARVDVFAPWMRTTAIITGVAGIVVGVLMLVDVATDVTFVAFRVVALSGTIVAIAIGLALRREPAPAAEPALT